MSDVNDPRDAAISRLKAKQAFKASLGGVVVLNVFMVAIWAVSGRGYFWPVWVMIPTLIGVAGHGWSVYGAKGITEADIQKEMGRGGGRI